MDPKQEMAQLRAKAERAKQRARDCLEGAQSCVERREFVRAEASYREAAESAEEGHDTLAVARAHMGLATVQLLQGRGDDAAPTFVAAAWAAELTSPQMAASAHLNLAGLLAKGESSEARRFRATAEQALRRAQLAESRPQLPPTIPRVSAEELERYKHDAVVQLTHFMCAADHRRKAQSTRACLQEPAASVRHAQAAAAAGSLAAGLAYLRKMHVEPAETNLLEAARLGEGVAPHIAVRAYFHLMILCWGDGRFEDERQHKADFLRLAEDIRPLSGDKLLERLFSLVQLNLARGNTHAAEVRLREVLEVAQVSDLQKVEAHLLLSRLLQNAGRENESVFHLREAFQLGSICLPEKASEAATLLGSYYSKHQESEEALDWYLHAYRLADGVSDSAAAFALLNVGRQHERLGQLALARSDYEQTAALATQAAHPVVDSYALFNAARLCRVEGRDSEAEQRYKAAIRLSDRGAYDAVAASHLNLGALYADTNRATAAALELRRALDLARAVLRDPTLDRRALRLQADAHNKEFESAFTRSRHSNFAGMAEGVARRAGAALASVSSEALAYAGQSQLVLETLRIGAHRLAWIEDRNDILLDSIAILDDLVDGIDLSSLAKRARNARDGTSVRKRTAGAARVLRERAKMWIALAVRGHAVEHLASRLASDLVLAEDLEAVAAPHPAAPVISSAWWLLDVLSQWVGTVDGAEVVECLATLCLSTAQRASDRVQCDEQGAAGQTPVNAAMEVLLRTLTIVLSLPGPETELYREALSMAEDALDASQSVPRKEGRVHSMRIQLLSTVLFVGRGGDHAASWIKISVRRLLAEMLESAQVVLEQVHAYHRQRISNGARLGIRAAEPTMLRAHLEAHLCAAWVASKPSGDSSGGRIVSGVAAKELFAAVLQNRAIIDLVEGSRSREVSDGVVGGASSGLERLADWLLHRDAAWVEIVVGLTFGAEIVVTASGNVRARVRPLQWTFDGYPVVLNEWNRAYAAFRNGAQLGVGDLARGGPPPTRSALAEFAGVLDQALDWALDWIAKEARSVCICPDSVLHDLPLVALGVSERVRVYGQALSGALCDFSKPRERPGVALFVVDREMAWSYGGWARIHMSLVRPLEAQGWTVHVLATQRKSSDVPRWRTDVGVTPGEMAVTPTLVVWLSHGARSSDGVSTTLQFHGGKSLSHDDLMGAAHEDGMLRLPGTDIEVSLTDCQAFLSGACVSGRVDPRYGPEGVGLVRGLMALGVREIFAPNYDALLTTMPDGSNAMLEMFGGMIAAVATGKGIGPALYDTITKISEPHDAGSAHPTDWWWGHAAVFVR